MKKIIATILIIIGIILILTPFLTEQIIKYYNKNISTDGISMEDIEANDKSEGEFDFSSVEDVDIKSIINGTMNFDKNLVVGVLIIPDLNINLPILKGLNDSNLMVGAATMKPEQSMGEGNYTLAGHHMKNKELLFGSLMDIQVGSKVIISDKKNIYEYKTYDTVVVPDNAMDMIEDEKAEKKGKPIISLMTCYHSSRTGKRFFALGELVNKYPFEDKNTIN